MSEINMDDAADTLFGASTHAQTTLHPNDANLTQPLHELDAANTNWREALRNTDLSAQEGGVVTDLVRTHLKVAPTSQQRETWLRETSESLTRKYGAAEARARLNAAKVLLQVDRRFAHTLQKAGVQDHPRIVEMLVEKAHSLRLKGRL